MMSIATVLVDESADIRLESAGDLLELVIDDGDGRSRHTVRLVLNERALDRLISALSPFNVPAPKNGAHQLEAAGLHSRPRV